MESEKRPVKMRKLEHAQEELDPEAIDNEPISENVESHNDTPSTEQLQDTTTGNEELCAAPDLAAEGEGAVPKLSKNQLKKQQRLERWEAGREDRKLKRKEKIKAKKERKREAWAEIRANNPQTGETPRPPSRTPRHIEGLGTQVPITIIFDCDFEDLMFDHELKSLGLQITRCYSDNRKAPYRCHLAVSSFGGKLKERFDGILAKQYTSWKGVKFHEEDFVKVSELAGDWMKGEKGGEIAGALKLENGANEENESNGAEEEGEVVYLSAESDMTLDRLKPNSTYIIGGLVDKNRHKGICYKRAMNRGIKTAKLPIGEFLQMNSRQVLVTNHVQEIMLKWLEFGDWGKAFMDVIPKRKGGVLKSEAELDDAEELETPIDAGKDVNAQEEVVSKEANAQESVAARSGDAGTEAGNDIISRS